MNGLNFVALDVETADSAIPESICQIGLAVVREGEIVESFSQIVHTPHKFAWWQRNNLSIEEHDVSSAPAFLKVAKSISHHMAGPVFSHTSYDKFAVTRACSACGHEFPGALWLDSAQIVRRAWPDRYGKSGYGRANLAADFGIELQHHDAGEDARAVAHIIIRACQEHQLGIDGWQARVRQPVSGTTSSKADVRRDGNVDGPLYGEVVVLTGGFDLPKSEQADLAAFSGCEVASGVTKKTTLVVVGDNRFALGERSGKWTKAEALMQQGYPIKIMSESDFKALIAD